MSVQELHCESRLQSGPPWTVLRALEGTGSSTLQSSKKTEPCAVSARWTETKERQVGRKRGPSQPRGGHQSMKSSAFIKMLHTLYLY